MLRVQTIENIISEYYDEQLPVSELLGYEARLAISKGIRDFTNERCFEYFKISNSIRLAKIRNRDKASKIAGDFIENKLLNINAVSSKGIYERLCKLFLDFLGYNSK